MLVKQRTAWRSPAVRSIFRHAGGPTGSGSRRFCARCTRATNTDSVRPGCVGWLALSDEGEATVSAAMKTLHAEDAIGIWGHAAEVSLAAPIANVSPCADPAAIAAAVALLAKPRRPLIVVGDGVFAGDPRSAARRWDLCGGRDSGWVRQQAGAARACASDDPLAGAPGHIRLGIRHLIGRAGGGPGRKVLLAPACGT